MTFLKRSLNEHERPTLRHVAADGEKPGWDIEYTRADGTRVCIEVKGTTGRVFPSIDISANEWLAAEAQGASYQLYLVARCLEKKPFIQIIVHPHSLVQGGNHALTTSTWCLRRVAGS